MANTPNLNLAQPAYNSTSPTWDQPVNQNFRIIDAARGGQQQINVTSYSGGPIVLTPTNPIVGSPITSMSYLASLINVTGTAGQDIIVQFPAGVGGLWMVLDQTTGGHIVTFETTTPGATYVVPQKGTIYQVYSDGVNVLSVSAPVAAPGDLKCSAAPATPVGWLPCDGRAVSRTTYAALWAAIGGYYGSGDGSTTFNIPDLRGRVPAAADNLGGTAAGRLSSWVLGSSGGEQVHVLTVHELATHSHSDGGHAHSDGGHAHALSPARVFSDSSGGSQGPYGVGSAQMLNANTAVGYANIQTGYAAIQNTGDSWGHNNVQPTLAVNWYIKT